MYLAAEKICQAIRQRYDVTADVAKIEPQLASYYRKRKQALEPHYDLAYDRQIHVQDALYDVSDSVKNYWDTIYPHIGEYGGRYGALLRFVNAREKFLGISQKESVHLLRQIGWTWADVMATYLDDRHSSSTLTLSPDVVTEAAHEDGATARQLMEKAGQMLFSNGYDMYRHFEWIDFMYFVVGYDDRSFLTMAHKSKRLAKHCQQVLDILERGPAQAEIVEPWYDCPDFSIFPGMTLHQQHVMASAAGQRLRKGNDNNGYYVMSFHLVDEVHGYGAALRFDAFNKSPDYRNEERAAQCVYFYKFNYLMLFDHVPESWRCAPTELPEGFVRKAYRAFSKLAGIEKK